MVHMRRKLCYSDVVAIAGGTADFVLAALGTVGNICHSVGTDYFAQIQRLWNIVKYAFAYCTQDKRVVVNEKKFNFVSWSY